MGQLAEELGRGPCDERLLDRKSGRDDFRENRGLCQPDRNRARISLGNYKTPAPVETGRWCWG